MINHWRDPTTQYQVTCHKSLFPQLAMLQIQTIWEFKKRCVSTGSQLFMQMCIVIVALRVCTVKWAGVLGNLTLIRVGTRI